jgi:5-methylcytosine-specific restriction protein A
MPTRPPSACTWPGCGALVTNGGRCPQHQTRRPSAAARGYDTRWQHIRRAYLTAHPRCECDNCLTLPEALRPVAIDVDHRDGQGPRNDNTWHNLRAMAHGHHSRRTAQDKPGGWNQR